MNWGTLFSGFGRQSSYDSDVLVVLQVSMETSLLPSVYRAFLGCELEKAVDEPNLSKKIFSCYPSNLLLPDHVDLHITPG